VSLLPINTHNAFVVGKGNAWKYYSTILYIKATVFVCLSVWAVPRRFFQSLPVPYGASPDVTSPNVTDSKKKRNHGQFDFLRQKIW
jgi:hypothetical protein